MRQSQLFTKTRKEAPKDEVSKNAILLTRAGFIHKELAGVYSYLPLGLRVLKKIENIIREEMNAIGGQELLLTALQDPEIWKKTNRWDDKIVDNWFKTKLANGNDLGIANTHEEPMAAMLTGFVSSYKDLPIYTYQFQTKFRNELRAKSGIMRVREFLMKDMYSFSRTEEEFKEFYEKCANAYMKIFARVGLGDRTYRTVAAGGSFTTNLTDEFQTLSDAGEDIIFITDEKNKRAINKEVEDKGGEGRKSIEVGNIFPYGSKYPDASGLHFKDEKGEKKSVFMGAYGIGLGRLMGTVVEALSDEKGIVWPKEIAPFQIHLLVLNDEAKILSDEVYKTLISRGIEVLYDDRDLRAGEKFADADLIGIPARVVIGEKSLNSRLLETRNRSTGEMLELSLEDLAKKIKTE